MAWFKREKSAIENPTPVDERRVRTEGCGPSATPAARSSGKKTSRPTGKSAPSASIISAWAPAGGSICCSMTSPGPSTTPSLRSSDPLHFTDTKPYAQRLKEAQQKLGMKDAIITAEGMLGGRPVICCSMEFGFIGGSMGAVVGEKVARAIERSLAKRQPLIIVSCSGGARMMEGTISLMQLAKVSAALARLDEARVPYISVLTDPTTGGVTASYAMLGDLNIAEPGALIGFAGPRVIEQTIRQKLPEGFQRAEFLLEHGFLDAVVPRKELKPYIAQALDFFLDS